ncbi:MAG: hypothetical protein ABSE73_15195 [Planctomycetota bacterium]
MPEELYPSSYVCDCGQQIDFFENTIREMKAGSLKKRICIDEGGADPHLVYFFKGAFDGIYCPVHKKSYDLPRREVPEDLKFTPKQGQYLAFIYYYTKLNRRAPAERDMEMYFCTTPPTVHQMVLTLEKKKLIARVPGVARSIELRVPREKIPDLE